MQPFIVDFIIKNKEELISRWLKEIEKVSDETYNKAVSNDTIEYTNKEFGYLILDTLELSIPEANERLSQYTDRLIRAGWQLSYFTQGLQAFRRVIFELLSDYEKDVKKLVELFYKTEAWIDGIINQLVNDYTGSWENTFELQKMSLLELSAPLIPVFENISVMPLVGTIDTTRAKLIMENLLDGVRKHRSQVVLIDITGVPVVDTMVAHHIIQAAEAIRLVGANCILVGIRPEIAQTIVNLGIDLSNFPTKSTLRKGIESALEHTKKQIIDL
ncbi:RsbT co-antagonist protein RsbRA [Bacillus alkalicellulosilyticus]|uniref:RsbT co-antagonist protein RsbRA n=1 Tax=Alkalihalobacterium alkalicellulosilyticum TaxID=1912214 RepID=UPI0009969673|nr:RsbT co-antagonist protein RsbRA [Bacillus alkalicellulosilyticus]